MAHVILIAMLLLPALAQARPMPVTCDGNQILVHDLTSGEAYSLWSKGASECVVDNRRRLIWFTDEGDLKVLELSDQRARTVVRNVERFIIEGNDNRLVSPGVLANPVIGGTTTLRLDSGRIELTHEPRSDPWASEREEPLETRKPRSVSKKVLRELAQRLPSRQPTCRECFEEAQFHRDIHEFSNGYRQENCQDGCGSGWAIPNSRLYMLAITDGCGDHCYRNLALFDPVRRVFLDPLERESDPHDGTRAVFWARRTYSVAFERSGRRALISPRDGSTRVVDAASFQTLAELEGTGAGWLYPQFFVEVEEAKPNDFSYETIGHACLRSPGLSEVRLSFEVDEIGRASGVKVRGAGSYAKRCLAARIVMQKWHREGAHRVVWKIKQPRYFR